MAYTEEQLALRIKEQYPQYQGIDNSELVSKVLDKYPEYGESLDKKEYEGNLLTEAGKLLYAGGAQSVLNAGGGLAQAYGMMLGDKTDVSDEAIDAYAAKQRGGSRMTRGKIKAHRLAKNRAIETSLENAARLRNQANGFVEALEINPEVAESLPGQVIRGLGQVPVSILAGLVGGAVGGPAGAVAGVAGVAAPQMTSEAISDAEATLGKSYMEMNEDERNQVALSTLGYTTLGTALETAGFLKAVPWMKRFLAGKTKVSAGKLKSLKREVAEGFAAEGFTEAGQGFLLDAFSKSTYDEDRQLMSAKALSNRFNEFLIGGLVGGIVSGTGGTLERAATGQLFKPRVEDTAPEDYVKDSEQTEGRKEYEVSYIDRTTGKEFTDTIDATSEEDARNIFTKGLGSGSTIAGTEFELVSVNPKETPEAPAPETTPPEGEPRFFGNQSDSSIEKVIQYEVADVESKIKRTKETLAELDAVGGQGWAAGARDEMVDEIENVLPKRLEKAKRAAERARREQEGRASGKFTKMSDDDFVAQFDKDATATPKDTPEPTPAPGPGPTEQPRLPEITADAARIPAVMERAAPLFEKIKAGEPITVQDSQALAGVVDSELPVSVFTAEQVEARPILSDEQMKTKLSDNKVDFVGKENFKVPVKDGTFVGLRLDIPAYDRPKDGGEPAFIVSVHEASPTGASFQAGAVAGYDSAAVIEDATFGIGKEVTGQKVALGIASGKPKSTIATMRGKYVDMSPEQAYAELKENLDSPEWTQVGMDPERRGYFYDRKTMREIVAADRVVQVGNMVLAKNVKYGPTPANEFVSRLTPGLVVGEPEVTAEAAPLVAPQKAELSHVQQKDIIDMDALIDDIVENDIPVWFWYADQLGDGDLALPNKPGQSVTLDAGPSYALQPANRAAGRVWASGKSVTDINNRISQLEYTDKDGNKKIGYLFLVSGSPDKMFLFNKRAFTAFYKNAFGRTAFAKVKADLLATNPPKAIRDSLQNHSSLKSLMDSAESRPFIEGLVNQRGKNTPLAQYLDSKGFFTLEPKQLRDGFYRDNNFRLNDIMLVVRPTRAVEGNANHGTYKNAVMGEVIGVPDRRIDAYLLIPDEVRKEKSITMEPSLAAQVVAPYGSRVTTIKKVVNGEQALRAVERLRAVVEGSPDGFTVDVEGEFANGGFIVAPDKSTERIIEKENFDRESLTQYLFDNADILNIDGAMLGGWYDNVNQRYVLDVVFAIDTLQDAVDIAIWGDQDAIFDLDTFTEIRTKDDNKNPTTPEGDTRSASEILKQKPAENLGEYSSQRRRDPRGVRPTVPQQAGQPVTVEAGTVLRPDEQPVEGGFNTRAEMDKYITEEFLPVAKKLGIDIVPNFAAPVARYNVTQRAIEYNPRELFKQSQDYIRSAMREEIIHAAMHKVLMNRSKSASPNQAWLNFFEKVGKDLTPEQRQAIEQVYRNLSDDVSYGAEYTRALIQQELYGRVTEQDLRFGPAFDKIKQLLKSVQIYISHALKGMSDERIEAAAVIKESADLLRGVDPTARPANQATIDAANRQVQEDSGILTAEAATELAKPPKKKKKKKGPLSFMDKYINTADTVLRRIHPEIANLFQRYVHSIDKKKFDALKRVAPFIQRYDKIKNKKDQRRLKQLLMYSPLEDGQEGSIELFAERDALLRKYDMYNLYKTNFMPVMFRIRSEAQEQGVDVGFLEGYFPRRVIDYEGLRESFGRPIAKDFRSYVDEINRQRRRRNLEQGKNEPLVEYGSEEEALIFEKYIRNGDYVRRGVKTAKPRSVNQRTIELIPDKHLDFYDDPGSALEYYISSMIHATETKRVFGERYVTDGEDVRLAGEIGPLFQDLMDRGEINEEAAFRTLPHVARMILNSANRENVFLGNMRQFSYLTTMVEFTSTISNLYDLPFVMERAGLLNTLNAIISPKYLRLTDYGIDNDRISDEFRDEKNFLTQSVKLGLKASGFTRLDQLLKETSLNAQYAKLRKDAQAYYKDRNSNRSKRFRTTIEAAVGKEQADATIAALKKGDRDNALVRDVVIRESLEKTQPITKMQQTLGAADNPNVRIVYQMKSFMVTQLNYVRNEYLADIFSGDRQRATQGTIRLARLMGFMILLGLPVDALKDFLAGRLGYMSDYMFNSIFRLAGVSKYQVYQTKKEGIGSALVGYVTPITVQQFMDYTAEFQRVASGDKALTASKLVSIAPFSDVLNRMFGFQKEKERREYIRRVREGERPTFIPPGSL